MLAWLTVIGLAATPALILGQTAACAAAIAFHLDPAVFLPVIAIAGFAEGLLLVWLSVLALRIPRLHRWLAKLRPPLVEAWARRWGPVTGMAVGPLLTGQEPILIALVWLEVSWKRLVLPLAISNAAYTVLYYEVVKLGGKWLSILF